MFWHSFLIIRNSVPDFSANFYEIVKARLRSAIFVQTVSFMHILCMEMRQPGCVRMPITVDTLGETKRDQTENSCLVFLNVLCCHRVCIWPYNYSLQSR